MNDDPAAQLNHSSRRLPAEWEAIEAIWLAWPHNHATWPDRFDRIPEFFANWVGLLAEIVQVRVLANATIRTAAERRVARGNIEWIDITTNDCWIRDYGPTFIRVDDDLQSIDWRYNAWGGKYPPWDDDDRVAALISQHVGIECVRTDFCLEGGAMETDGLGRILTTSSCLLAPTRNPSWTSERIAQHLYKLLGVTEIVWLDGGGVAGDDTDGHIDQLARFIDPTTVVVAVCDDHDDPSRDGLQTNLRQLEIWASSTEPTVNVHPLPIPPARHIDGVRVPESYCNFLRLGRECLLVPTFGHRPSDDHAIALLGELAGCDTIGVDCQDLIWGLGALHCASLNQPKV